MKKAQWNKPCYILDNIKSALCTTGSFGISTKLKPSFLYIEAI